MGIVFYSKKINLALGLRLKISLKTILALKIQKRKFHSYPQCFLCLFLIISCGAFSCNNTSAGNAGNADTLSEKSVLAKRIFYFLYQVENSPKIKKDIANDQELTYIHGQERKEVSAVIKNCRDMDCLVNVLVISTRENDSIISSLNELYKNDDQTEYFIEKKIRPSHAYILSANLSDSALFIEAWQEEKKGLNYILHAYLQNKGLHYTSIDSSRFNVNSSVYFDKVKQVIKKLLNKEERGALFFQPTLNICLAVLELNGRNEAARFIPLGKINQKAYYRISSINWNDYDYSSILVFGSGPGKRGVSISTTGKNRCRMGAAFYKKKKAPFIIVSGGYVHPFQTKYNEAEEMKKFLIDSLQIPAEAIIMEPHARHTTTNIRNSCRIVFRQNIPRDKPVLGVTSKSHIDYIIADRFKKACRRDFGYLPFTKLKRLSDTSVVFYPSQRSLQINAVTPLDP